MIMSLSRLEIFTQERLINIKNDAEKRKALGIF